jgi:hypothetical protein
MGYWSVTNIQLTSTQAALKSLPFFSPFAISQTHRMYEQRFNVAVSRARERLILVRSVIDTVYTLHIEISPLANEGV